MIEPPFTEAYGRVGSQYATGGRPVKFIMDFKADWHEILKEIMRNEWGMDTKGLTTDIPVHYFNAIQRRITARRRTLLISDTFQ